MELFVINRHGGEQQEVTEQGEKAKLEKILKKIERKRQNRIRQRERERDKQRAEKAETSHRSDTNSQKPENETKRVKISENEVDEFIDTPAFSQTEIQEQSDIKSLTNLKGFTILGAENVNKKIKAKRVLPTWLAKPTVISCNLQNLTSKVSKMKQLDKSIREQLKSYKVKYFFPVQAEVIPWLLESHKYCDSMIPRDLCVSAPTGSGKTLAFVLPVIQLLKRHTVRKIRALVILPTQDLAEQVFKTFKLYTQGTSIEPGLISGKRQFSVEQKQLLYLSESFGYVDKVDILICTAGRLVSHLKSTPGFNLQSLEFLIIDEADRVLESVQDDWLYHLEKHIAADEYTIQNRKVLNLFMLQKQRSPQKLLFSATLTQDPEKIEKLSLFQPKLFTSIAETATQTEENSGKFTGKYTTPNELTEKYILCSKDVKPLVLYLFIKSENLTKTLVFTHSVESAHRLKILLQSLFKSKLKIEEVSSSLKGVTREELISSFTRGEIDLLICTDSLARGIDLPGVNCVVSYSAPKYLKTHVHRVGRTARAGEQGLAVTLLHNEQVATFKSLITQLKKEIDEVKIDEDKLESLSERYKKALTKLRETITQEAKAGKNNIVLKKKALKMVRKQPIAKVAK